MITANIIGGEELVVKLQTIGGAVHAKLLSVITRKAIKLQAYTVAQKLSGQSLKVRTGRLRRSINSRVNDSAKSIIGIVGTNVEYAARHEYGFHGTVNVREHSRTTKSGGTCSVRAYSYGLNYNGHPFLRPALSELQDSIISDINKAVNEAMK